MPSGRLSSICVPCSPQPESERVKGSAIEWPEVADHRQPRPSAESPIADPKSPLMPVGVSFGPPGSSRLPACARMPRRRRKELLSIGPPTSNVVASAAIATLVPNRACRRPCPIRQRRRPLRPAGPVAREHPDLTRYPPLPDCPARPPSRPASARRWKRPAGCGMDAGPSSRIPADQEPPTRLKTHATWPLRSAASAVFPSAEIATLFPSPTMLQPRNVDC